MPPLARGVSQQNRLLHIVEVSPAPGRTRTRNLAVMSGQL